MISRRLIRIKAFKTLFAYNCSGSCDIRQAETTLTESCEKVRELYYFLLNISGSLISVAQEKINAGMHKFRPTEEELNPNLKFVNNRFAKILDEDPDFGKICQKKGLSWVEQDAFVKKIYASILTKDYFRSYMTSGEDSLEEDCRLFSCIFQDEFEDNEELLSILEDMSPLWIDDVAYVLNTIIDNIEKTGSKKKIIHPSTFLKEEDKLYAIRLMDESIANFSEYSALIYEKLANWDADRLVATDIVLIVMGISEAVNFPTIPTKVTIDEYVEISKYYSTPNSRIFVNGILDKIIREKTETGEIRKQGRGLIG